MSIHFPVSPRLSAMPGPVIVVDLLPESPEAMVAAAAVPRQAPAMTISSSRLPSSSLSGASSSTSSSSPSPAPPRPLLASSATPAPSSRLEKQLPRTPPELEIQEKNRTRPRARPNVTIRIPKRGWPNSSAMSKPALLTEAEYEALPPSIQRKYFSSLERLRIAEHTAQQQQQTKSRPLARFPGPVVVTKTSSPTTSRPRPWTQRGNSRVRKSHSLQRDCTISHAEAQWFLSLPEKVRRQQFSREEQVLLAGGLDTYYLDHLNEKSGQPVTAVERHHDCDLDYESDPLSEKRGCLTNRHSSHLLRKDSFTKDNSELVCIDAMAPSPEVMTQRPRRSSMRRTMSSTSVTLSPLRQSTSSTPSVQSSFGSRRPLLRPRAQSHAMPALLDTGRTSVDGPAKHYQDPDARQKLKTYLGSAQKFDEAIEFGFPSTHTEEPAPSKVETVSSGLVSYDVANFLRDEVLSCMESYAGDQSDRASARSEADTEGDLDSPVTPSDFAHLGFRHGGRSNFSSLDSSGLPPSWPNLKPYPQDAQQDLFSGAREMTLRMTLTRPDLRANEEELYGWRYSSQAPSKDPLALEALPAFTSDVDGSHSPFSNNSPRSSLIGRLFGKIKKKT
ncbi:hypothetical protein EJ05DRAFT_154868 [Pseudovirgaria hyperparasitica]|uniref:Mucin n=1 Tax=Pseudovirgaria hyperparasitica TaxID=470096 RepID=A0A6A6VUB2_9PEZI|nr:uncharacterized protein EJ05DRAFT_154868 [Pseudovirgaria hyperparasitica]KAF2754278.1 hypothetical protein EJ05DRAFT_154868 [Pseudovirgaria hyperparasitica]